MKVSCIKIHEIPSIGSRAVTCGQKNGQTDKHTKLKRTFCDYGNARENGKVKFMHELRTPQQ